MGHTLVKGYPDEVLDEKGNKTYYEVPLYEVRIHHEGKEINQTFRAIRFGVRHKGNANPFVTAAYEGTFNTEWKEYGKYGPALHVIGAGNGGVWIHLGPAQGYIPGANGCVEIFGPGGMDIFQKPNGCLWRRQNCSNSNFFTCTEATTYSSLKLNLSLNYENKCQYFVIRFIASCDPMQ